MSPDYVPLSKAQDCIKDFLMQVSHAVAVEERRERLADIYKAMDPVTSAVVGKDIWKVCRERITIPLFFSQYF